MIEIKPLTDTNVSHFNKMFNDYYSELDCDEDVCHLLDEYVIPDIKAGLIFADLLEVDGVFAGFVIYQRDDIDNEWCPMEGWGDIREIYVSPEHRKKGFGKCLLLAAEKKLCELGAEKAYVLPAQNTENFFTSCGYKKANLYNEELDCFVYEKTSLKNIE